MTVIRRELVWLVPGVSLCLGAMLLLALSPGHAQSPANGETEPVTVQVSSNDAVGEYLTDGKGRTLYRFAADSRGVSKCHDFCANAFPAYTIEGRPVAGDGVLSSLIGTVKRSNGDTQVTYSGHPLYYFQGDMKSGSIAGDGTKKYGGEWSAVAPDGSVAEATAVAKAEADRAGAKKAETTAQSGTGDGQSLTADPQTVAAGKELYSRFGCYGCHGRGGGGGMGPSLIDNRWRYGGDDAALFKTITQGRPKGMPAYGQQLSDQQVRQVIAFVRSLSTQSSGGGK